MGLHIIQDLRQVLAELVQDSDEQEKRPTIPAQVPSFIKSLIRSCWSRFAAFKHNNIPLLLPNFTSGYFVMVFRVCSSKM
jgi:hypothetical protein